MRALDAGLKRVYRNPRRESARSCKPCELERVDQLDVAEPDGYMH